MLTYRTMTPAEQKACAALAADAFFDYEFFTDYIPDDRRRRRFLRKLMDVELRVNADRAVLLVAEEESAPVALAMLCPPEYVKPSDGQYIAAGFLGVLLAGGFRDASAWNDMNERNDAPCKAVRDAWYLSLLTVAPEHKGQGIGTRFLQDGILPYVRAKGGQKLTLVTNSESNRRFYQKLGFAPFHEQVFTYKGKELGGWSYQMELDP